ncbi:MAG: putative lipid II flippase FtsW [Pseudomonadota bacterium]
MKERAGFDYIVLFVTLVLVSIGIVMVYSASAIIASERFNDGYFFLRKQIFFALLGILIMIGVARINHQFYGKIAYVLLGISFVSLIAVLVPGIGVTVGGSTRWLKLGVFSVQPSEFAKLAVIIYIAYSLAKKEDNIKKFSVGLLPHMIITGIMLSLIVKQPDMGTAVCIGAIVFTLLFAAGVRLSHLSLTVLLTAPIIYFLISNIGYRRQRILAFLDPWEYPTDSGFQIIQSLYAFGAGGLFGRGLGGGKQKLFYLPEPYTDFIFSVIGEELGLIGVLFILVAFLILIYRGIRIAIRVSDSFSTYLALGITTLIGLQASVHMGVTVGLLPTKGISLPFISYGGSSLLTSLIGLGILLNISSQIKKG